MTSAFTSVRFATSISCHIFVPTAAQRFTYRPRSVSGVGTSTTGGVVSRGVVSRAAVAAPRPAGVAAGAVSARSAQASAATSGTKRRLGASRMLSARAPARHRREGARLSAWCQ